MKKTHNPKKALEHPITEGRTYLAEIVVCPWAYRKIEGQKSTVGQIVRVTAGRNIGIEWESGDKNGVDRSNVRIIGEAPTNKQ